MSTYYETHGFTFLTLLNEKLMTGYRGLAKDLGIDIQSRGLSALSNIEDRYFVDFFNSVLTPTTIIQLRNTYMSNCEGLLDTCIERQQSLTRDVVMNGFKSMISEIVKMFIDESPIIQIVNKFPVWTSDNTIGSHELAIWTEYALAGGNTSFAINSEGVNMYSNDALYKVPDSIAGKRALFETEIQIVEKYISCQPFSANDFVLRMISSKVKNEFDNLQTDIFEGAVFSFSENDLLRNIKEISEAVRNLYLHGTYVYSGTAINDFIYAALANSPQFKQELMDINALTEPLLEFTTKPIAASSISAFIFSLIPNWALEICMSQTSIKDFSIFRRLFKLDLKNVSNVLNKLADMVVSFTLLKSSHYCKFVNNTVDDFLVELTEAKNLYVPFIKGMEDKAEVYAIGGCEMYSHAKHANPLIRAINWCSYIFGVDEDSYTVMKYVETFSNSSLLELMESYSNNPEEMISLLKVQFQKMFSENKIPRLLNNYQIENSGNYTLKPYTFVTDLKIFTVLCKYIFEKSSPIQSTERSVNFVPINISVPKKITVGQMTKNKIIVDSQTLPVHIDETSTSVFLPLYDYNSSKEYINISFITPGGCRCIWLNMFGNKIDNNLTSLILTNASIKTRFQKYEFDTRAKPRSTKQAEMITPTLTSARYLAERNMN